MSTQFDIPGRQQQQQQLIDRLLKTEIRHIEESKLVKLSEIIGDGWERLSAELTRPRIDQKNGTMLPPVLNLPPEASAIIKQQYFCGKSSSFAFLNHWAITGRRRPTIGTLLDYLRSSGLLRAEDHVRRDILGIKSLKLSDVPSLQPPSASFIITELESLDIEEEFKFTNLASLIESLDPGYIKLSFRSIYESTNRFCGKPFETKGQSGFKIGEGRFSSVYRAATSAIDDSKKDNVFIVAAKLLKSNCNEKYLANEINLMRKISHPNLIPLVGLAIGELDSGDPGYICLVYPYMQNGSLLDCLSYGVPSRSMGFIDWTKRVEIATKIARGIVFLHSNGPIIHRDIKTANILLSESLEPKVGDFTLVRQLDTMRATETQFSQSIIGTSVYMPPEAFRGDISIKFDTFSFGIVLLELLTGMRPFNEELGESLFTFIEEKLSDIDDELAENKLKSSDTTTPLQEARDEFLSDILDKKAGSWDFNTSRVLFDLALQALRSRKKSRPELSILVPTLEAMLL